MPTPSRLLRCEPLEDRTAPAAGDLDPTFGTGGQAHVPFDAAGGRSSAADVAVLPGGEMVVVGTAGNPSAGTPDAFAVARMTRDGAPDPAFGVGGQVLVPVGAGNSSASAVAVQADGKVVVVGNARVTSDPYSDNQFAVVRLNPDGSLDPAFGTGGKVLVAVGTGTSSASAVAIQPDGKIVVTGEAFLAPDGSSAFNTDFAVVRLNPDGSLDPSFDADGRLTIPFDLGTNELRDEPSAVVIQPDGKIVVAGAAEVRGARNLHGINFGRDFAVARLNPDGSLDGSFAGTGKVHFSLGSGSSADNEAADAFLQPDGRIVLAGYTGSWSIFLGRVSGSGDFAVVRLNPDGSFDGSFGVEGKTTVPLDPATPGGIQDFA
ncbi:MAG TPA: hypothetical protein VM533_01020, partial [Fimbriiglobus sp.]|nr:hypothetical protein [Fimbriiglobus sp.]